MNIELPEEALGLLVEIVLLSAGNDDQREKVKELIPLGSAELHRLFTIASGRNFRALTRWHRIKDFKPERHKRTNRKAALKRRLRDEIETYGELAGCYEVARIIAEKRGIA